MNFQTEIVEYNYSRVGGFTHRFFARPGTYDRAVISEVAQYSLLDYEDQDVLDIGANIGSFTVLACQLGARSVTAVEPDPDNFALLGVNVPLYASRVSLVCAAAVSDPDLTTVPLYRAPNLKNLGTHSLWIKGRRLETKVKAEWWGDIIGEKDYGVIKLDCEGSEMDLILNGGIPDTVTQIVFELHLNKREWREKLGPAVVDYFKDWECLRKPNIGPKNWATLAAYRR